MKICAVICEFNPFHTGHEYLIDKALRRYDAVVCLMSGNFVQRAEPSIAEKYARAEIALKSGASLVAELPIVYATANGERFASGAIRTLKSLGQIDALVAGCETDSPELIALAAEIQANETDEFKRALKSELDEGKSYAAALTVATALEATRKGADGEKITELLSSPNNLLCVEYVKAIMREKLSIKPEFVRRVGDGYNDKTVRGDYASATAVRELLACGDVTAAIPYLGSGATILIDKINRNPVNIELFKNLVLFALKRVTAEEIATAPDCREGLDKKIFEAAATAKSLDELLAAVKSKRYTMARLKRVALQVALGISGEFVKECDENELPIRVLAVREEFKPMFAYCKNLVLRSSDLSDFASPFDKSYLELERKAAALYAQVTSDVKNLFYPQKLVCI